MSGSFWRRTPPALFPATLGVLGLSLAWRTAERAIGAPGFVADVVLAFGGGFLIFALTAYLAKLIVRPSVVFADLNPTPGKAAVSAGSMCLMLFAVGLHQVSGHGVAAAIWLFGVGLHFAYMLCVIAALRRSPPDQRTVTPVLLLPFVGYIVAPIGGVEIGFPALSGALYLYTLVAGVVIVALSVPRFLVAETPVPARAPAAILLAPTSVAAISADALGYSSLFSLFIAASLVVAALLILRIGWLTAGGFTPLWGAFTFPSSSLAGAMALAADRWVGVWQYAAWATLLAATVIVAPIWVLTIIAWARGRLAPATGAATV